MLDLCCGTGLMAAELPALGYDVVGVDASAVMLARARGLLGPDATLLQQSLPDLDVEGSFDAAISTFEITSVVDSVARTCDARIDVSDGGAAFTEHRIQYFHTDDEVDAALDDAGLVLVSVLSEYTAAPCDSTTLRATWVARRAP